MPIEALPGYLQIEKQEQATPRKYTAGDVFSEGISSGFNEHTFSYLSDITTRYSTSLDTQEITEEDFYKHPSYRKGMNWVAGMNYDLLNQYSESYADRQRGQVIQENTDNFYIPYFAGGFLAGTTDPINWIGLGVYKKGAGLLSNAVRAGGANAAIETMITPLVSEAYEARSQEYGLEQYATNLMFSFAAGSAISTVAQGGGKLLNMVPSVRAMGHADDSGYSNLAALIRKEPKEFAVDTTTSNLIKNNLLYANEAPGTNVRNTNPFVSNVKQFVDSTGQIHNDVANARTNTNVTTYLDIDGVPVIQGSSPSVLKIIRSVIPYLGDTQSIKIIRTDENTAPALLGKNDVEKFVATEIEKYGTTRLSVDRKRASDFFSIKDIDLRNFKAELDTLTTFRTRDRLFDVTYELEYDLKNPNTRFDPEQGIGKMYSIDADGKRTLLSLDDTKRVYRDVFQNRLKLQGGENQLKINKPARDLNEEMAEMSDTVSKGKEAIEEVEGKKTTVPTEEKIKKEINKSTDADTAMIMKLQQAALKIKNKEMIELLLSKSLINFDQLNLRYDPETGTLTRLGDVKITDPEQKIIYTNLQKLFLDATDNNNKIVNIGEDFDSFIKCRTNSEGL